MLVFKHRVLSFIATILLCLFVFTATDVEGYASWCEINQTIFVLEESTASFLANFTYSSYYLMIFQKNENTHGNHRIFYASVRDNNITDDHVHYFDPSWQNRTHISSQVYSIDQIGIRIDVHNISMKDNGTYRLDYMRDDACFILYVMQILSKPSGNGAIEENKPVYVYAHPYASVIIRPLTNATMVWLLDGLSVNQTASFIQQDGLIWIPHIQRGMDGRNVTYRAIQDNGNVNEVNYTLNVMYGPSRPLTLVPDQTQYHLKSGDIMPDITCTADCKPPCSISWGTFSSSGTLSLGTATSNDTGQYTCTAARTGVNTVEQTVNIHVTEEPAWSVQLLPAKVVYIVSVGDIMPPIMCTADCNPPCDVSWGTHSSNGQLALGTVTKVMTGEYMCAATRKMSTRRIEKSVTIHVQDEQAWLIHISPPKMVYIVYVGDTLPEISCTADCNPPCDVSWGSHSSSGRLTLGSVSKEMNGEYMCTATRKGSTRRVEKSITIYVQDNTSFTIAVACVATIQVLTMLGIGLCTFFIYCRTKQSPWQTCFSTIAKKPPNINTADDSKSLAVNDRLEHYEDLDIEARHTNTVYGEVNLSMTALPAETGFQVYENTKLSTRETHT